MMVRRLRSVSSERQPLLTPKVDTPAKTSFLSPTTSFEADDEHSIDEIPLPEALMSRMDSEGGYLLRRKRYEAEDVRHTTQKELAGWYSYGWAGEVFMICGIGSFIPITLEQLAREVGFLASDPTAPCSADDSKLPPDKGSQCLVSILGWHVNTASFAMYTFSFSVLLQTLVILSMSGAADHGRYRKTLLLGFGYAGSVAMMLFLPVVPSVFVLGAVWAVIANVCAGASFVLLNSFLPVLVRNHPAVIEAEEEDKHAEDGHTDGPLLPQTDGTVRRSEDGTIMDSTAQLLPTSEPDQSNVTPSVKSTPALHLSTKISAYGIGIGYLAAVIFQLSAIILLLLIGNYSTKHSQKTGSSETFPLRLVLFLIGIWWAVFMIPSAFWLRPRPGPPLAKSQSASWSAYLAHSWKVLFKTVARTRHLRDVALFLAAWFLLSDALATVSGTAILFAKTELKMAPAALAMISVVATLFGVIGAFFWSWLSRRFQLGSVQTICAIVALFELVPLYGLLGYIPAVRESGRGGLQQDWEMYLLGAVYGLVLGGVGAHCRALFGELVPAGSEAAFFALYAITDKGSSIFGPAVVGIITNTWGEIRPSFVFLAVLVALPGPILWFVDISRGKRDAERAAAAFGYEDEDGEVLAAEETSGLLNGEHQEHGHEQGA